MEKAYKDIIHKQIDYFVFETAKDYGLNRNDVVEEIKQYINQFKNKNAPEVKPETLTMEQKESIDWCMNIKKLCSNCLLGDEDLEECEECNKRSEWTPNIELQCEIKRRCKAKDSCKLSCMHEISKESMTCASLANLVFEE